MRLQINNKKQMNKGLHMLKLTVISLALLLAQQISPMINFLHETAWEEFGHENPKGKALIDAACDGDIAQVQMLIQEGVDVDTKDPNRLTALHYAAIRGHEELCKFLIEQGADTHYRFHHEPAWKNLLLLPNATNSDLKIAGLLLNPHNFPTPKACSQAIITFLHCVKKNKKLNDINLLFSNHWKTLLKPHFLCIMREASKISQNINEKDSMNMETALMHTARYAKLDACKWLIQHGADVNIQDNDSGETLTALSIARSHQQYAKERLGKDRSAPSLYAEITEICELLLANGAIE
jgi:ankyrin repeat protein